VQVPAIACPRAPTAECGGEGRSELLTPEPDGLVAPLHPRFGQQVLYVPVTQVVPVIQPHGVADDLRREAIPAGKRTTAERNSNAWSLRVPGPQLVNARGRAGHGQAG